MLKRVLLLLDIEVVGLHIERIGTGLELLKRLLAFRDGARIVDNRLLIALYLIRVREKRRKVRV